MQKQKNSKHTEQWFGVSANIFAFVVAASSAASKCHYDIFINKYRESSIYSLNSTVLQLKKAAKRVLTKVCSHTSFFTL